MRALLPSYRASPNEVTSRSIVDPLRRKDFATVWLSLHSTSLCSLIAAVAATIAALALAWARNGAVAGLLSGVLDHVRELFGIG
jgi:hypothetical protein